MERIISFFIKYPVWPNVIKILFLAFGLIALMNLSSSFFPEIENRVINIQILYPGASPEEIESGIINKIEDNLKGLQGLERYTSIARENIGSITIETMRGYDVDDLLMDVKNAVSRISAFPAGMEPPVVFKVPATEFAISFAIKGDMDLKALKEIGRKVEDDLRSMDGVSQIAISGYPAEEIAISFDETKMLKYGLTFDMVASAVRNSNIDLSAGSVKTDTEELLIRLEAKNYYADEIAETVILSNVDGSVVRLRDIAQVEDTWEDSPKKNFVDGQRSIIVKVSKIVGEDIVEIANVVTAYVAEFNQKYDYVEAIIIEDATIPLKERLNMLIENGMQGVLLVLIALALFLNLRLSFWVALGLPFSFLGMFLLLYLAGLTINAISLFGCILVVGILVDDGIVISEQIYQNYEEGETPFKAALKGVMQVLPSVIFAILTTLVAFIPFFFFAGKQGENMRDMAFVVIATIIFSLIESVLILPSHLAHSKALRKKIKSPIREKIEKFLLFPRDVIYSKSLKFFMERKIIIVALSIFLSMITIGAFSGGLIKVTFFPFLDIESFEVSVQMPPGTREDVTKQVLESIEKSARKVNEKLKSERQDGKDVITFIEQKTATGSTGLFGAVSEAGSNEGTLVVHLLAAEQRGMEGYKIANMLQEQHGPVYGTESVLWGGGSRFGKPISIPLISSDLQAVSSASEELKDSLAMIPDLKDIADNVPLGMREIKITLNDKAKSFGLNNLDVSRQIRSGFFGNEIQRLQKGSDEIKVWARYSSDVRSSLENFEKMTISTASQGEYPLSELITYTIKRRNSVINHLDGKREITVSAEMVDLNAAVPPVLNRVKQDILPKILAKYPAVTTAESGQEREIMKTARSAQASMSVAFFLIFFLIVLSFRSYSQAIVVFSLIPLGFIGAFWGHYFHNMPVNMMSAYGLVALLGIIVNNSIVFINTMNGYLRSGKSFYESVYNAAINRYRPILLTTITTVVSLFPLILSESRQAAFLVPMALSVAYGLLIGSVFILMFLPVFIVILSDIKHLIRKISTGKDTPREDLEPAVRQENIVKEYFGGEK